jgi:hypothetical protein
MYDKMNRHFFGTRGERASLKIAILCRLTIFALSNIVFFQKTVITGHKKSLFPHTWYHGNRLNHAVIDYPKRGARGAAAKGTKKLYP